LNEKYEDAPVPIITIGKHNFLLNNPKAKTKKDKIKGIVTISAG
jgi:hypothetical protein